MASGEAMRHDRLALLDRALKHYADRGWETVVAAARGFADFVEGAAAPPITIAIAAAGVPAAPFKERRKVVWTPEMRAAQAKRMRAARAAGKLGGKAPAHADQIPERATAVDPEPKPAEPHDAGVEAAGSSSEAAPAERGGGPATSRPRMPGDTGTAGCAGGAGGSPAPDDDVPAAGGEAAAAPHPAPLPASGERENDGPVPARDVAPGSLAEVMEGSHGVAAVEVAPFKAAPVQRCVHCDRRLPGDAAGKYCGDACRNAGRSAAMKARAADAEAARDRAAKARSAEETDQVARFLAEKGATLVQSPEQVAEFLRGKGCAVTIRIPAPAIKSSNPSSWTERAEITLDGRKVSAARFYAIANEWRSREGLKPLALPKAA